MTGPNVLIAAPVRNRAWILRDYLARLVALDWPVENRRFFFLVNDSTDESEAILRSWGNDRMGDPWRERVEIRAINRGVPPDQRQHAHRQEFIHGHLAVLRNTILEEVATGEWLFSVDTDILLPADALRRLMDREKDVVAATISNAPRNTGSRLAAINASLDTGGACTHAPGLREVNWTGAAYLLSPRAVTSGARYADHPAGEDLPFCEGLRKAGLKLWIDGDVLGEHCLDRHDLEAARSGRYWEVGVVERALVSARGRAWQTMISGCHRCCGQIAMKRGLVCALKNSECGLPDLWSRVERGEVDPADVTEGTVAMVKGKNCELS